MSVSYGGVPQTIVGSPIVFGSPYGFVHTDDGAFMGDEPNAASTWIPMNDHPGDKATWTFRVTVPAGLERDRQRRAAQPAHAQRQVDVRLERAVPDGELPRHRRRRQLGHPHRAARRAASRRPWRSTRRCPPSTASRAVDFFYDTTAEATDLWSQTFGPYPFDSTGAIADNANYNGQAIGFSLETQTRPLYSDVRSDLDDRARAGAPVVRRQRLGADVAQHLAQRGLRDLRAVPVGRAQGRAAPTSRSWPTTAGRPTRPSGRSRSPTRSATRCSPAPSTAAAA